MSSYDYFGFEKVPKPEKEKRVQDVFSSVAHHYDLMNDLMSFGLHRIWKKHLLSELIGATKDNILLDVAGGTGDVAIGFLENSGARAIVCDLNHSMLLSGKQKVIDQNKIHLNLDWVHGSAENLPFPDSCFDYCTISFGIRNVTNINKALSEIHRVLKPGGKFACLEFSDIDHGSVKRFYDLYSFKIIPKIGALITGSRAPYQYLVESIRKFPNSSKFASLIEKAGFQSVAFRKMTFGIVAIHKGIKYRASA